MDSAHGPSIDNAAVSSSFRQATRPPVLAQEVRVAMALFVFSHERVSIDAVHPAHDGGEAGLPQLDQVAVDRRLIPVRVAQQVEHLREGHRTVRVGQDAEHRKARRGHTQTALAQPPTGLVLRVSHGPSPARRN